MMSIICEESRSSSSTHSELSSDRWNWAIKWMGSMICGFSAEFLSLTLSLSCLSSYFSVPKTWAVVQMGTHSGMPLAACDYVHFTTLTLPVSASAFVWCARECFYHLENTRNSIQLSTFGFFFVGCNFSHIHSYSDGEFFSLFGFSHL